MFTLKGVTGAGKQATRNGQHSRVIGVLQMGDFGKELRRLMVVREIGVRELARQVPCNAGHISALGSGTKRPSERLARRLDDILGAGGKLLALVVDDETSRGSPVGRALLDELAGHALEFGQWTEATNVGAGTIEQLDDAVNRIACDYLSLAPEPLIARAADVSRRVFSLLREHQRLRHTRELCVIGAKSCAFLAWAAGDLGHPATAAAQGRAALILADEADHPGARAVALCAMSKTVFWDGQRSRAGDLARRGYECCPRNSTRVLLACQEADAAPLPAAHEAIDRAKRAREEIIMDDDLAGVFAGGQVRLANYLMGIYLRAGDLDAVLEMADNASISNPVEQVGYGTWGQIHIGAGIAHLRAGELEGAIERLGPVLALPTSQRLTTLTGRLSTLAPALSTSPYSNQPKALGLAEHIRAYCSEAARARELALPAPEGTLS
jgi:Helix-turn-helix domain